jgi:hypothetical protein
MHAPDPHDPNWVKSTFSDQGENCVELRRHRSSAAARDSKNPNGPTLFADISSLVAAAKTGRLDR